eukprot:2626515-Prymnesium_polylepis.1
MACPSPNMAGALSADGASAAAWRSVFSVGTQLPPLMVLSTTPPRVLFTAKPSLIAAHAAGLLPSTPTEVEGGTLLVGHVTKLTEAEATIGLLGGLHGTCAASKLVDEGGDCLIA